MKLQDVTINNKYTNWYIKLMTKARTRASTRKEAEHLLKSVVEAHHIVPVSIYRNTDVVFLTLREHFIAHRLLINIVKPLYLRKMQYAMACFTQGRKLSSREVAVCMQYKHLPCSDQRRANISKARKLTVKKLCPHCNKEFDPGNYSQFHGENCKTNPNIDSKILKDRSEKARKSYKTQLLNETYNKPKALIGVFECPICSFKGTNWGSMQRWHYDNCTNIA